MTFDFDINAIYTLVMSVLPMLIDIIIVLFGLKKIFRKTQDIETIKTQYGILQKENAKLNKKINELLTKLDHVERKE